MLLYLKTALDLCHFSLCSYYLHRPLCKYYNTTISSLILRVPRRHQERYLVLVLDLVRHAVPHVACSQRHLGEVHTKVESSADVRYLHLCCMGTGMCDDFIIKEEVES